MMMTALRFSARSAVALAAAVVLASAFADDARGSSGGIFGHSGRTPNLTCALATCHGPAAMPSVATFTMTPLNRELPSTMLGYVPGAAYTVTVRVTGGPDAARGFNFDSDAGTGRNISPVTTRKNTSPLRPAEFTHSTIGRLQREWSFEWTAPSARQTVSFWLMGNSVNGNGRDTGDAPSTPVTMQLDPVPAEVLCRVGNVNDAAGDPVPVLFVNGSRGDDSRTVEVPTGDTPMEIAVESYPGAPASIPYVIYALRRANRPDDEVTLPQGVGQFCFTIPLTGGSPVVVANTLGHEPNLGSPRVRGTQNGPGVVLAIPRVPSKVAGARITLQGLVPDSTAPSRAAVTNAIVVSFL